MNFEYAIIRSKRKSLSVVIDKQAKITVKAPYNISKKTINDFLYKNVRWIENKHSEILENLSKIKEFNYEAEDELYYFGELVKLSKIIPDFPEEYSNRVNRVHRFLHEETSNILIDRIFILSVKMNAKYTGLKITSARRRWGSCSYKNSLCFSRFLVCLPPDIIDAIIVHELAHITHKNHSKEFYAEVEKYIPNYNELNEKLRLFEKTFVAYN